MPETPPSVLDRFLGSDATMYAGPGEITQAYANKMLLAALQEAQSVVRSYDTKAQIVGVGYILALNLILHFGDLLPTHANRWSWEGSKRLFMELPEEDLQALRDRAAPR